MKSISALFWQAKNVDLNKARIIAMALPIAQTQPRLTDHR
jgi:hypothetical protein